MSAASRLLDRVGGHRRWIAATSALGIVTSVAGIALIGTATYLLTRSGFDTVGVSLSMAILGVRSSAIVRVVARYVDRYIGHLGTFEILSRMRGWLFDAVGAADARLVMSRDRGEVVTALVDDVDTMQDHLLRVAVPPMVALGTLIIATFAIASIDLRAGLTAIAILCTSAAVLTASLHRSTARLEPEIIELRSRRASVATEALDALDELAVWGRTDLLIDPLAAINDLERPLRRRAATIAAAHDALMSLSIALAVVAAAALLADSAPTDARRWWIAAVPVMVLAASECLAPLLAAARTSNATDRAARQLLDLTEHAATSPDVTPDPTPDPASTSASASDQPGLTIAAVTFRHPDGPTILRDADLHLPPGTTAWISAPSGVGKSSVVALLAGLVSPDAGSVTLDTIAVADLDRTERTPLVTALQHDHVFDTTIRDNLLVADGTADDDALLGALTTAGLGRFIAERPGALDAPTGPDGRSLSGGERQRLVLARAIAADADVLLLDEPFEHLESDQGRALLDAILQRRRGRTTVVFAHEQPTDDAIVRVTDRRYELRDGRLDRID